MRDGFIAFVSALLYTSKTEKKLSGLLFIFFFNINVLVNT